MMLVPELFMLFFSVVFLFMSLGRRKNVLPVLAQALSLVGFLLTLVSVTASGSLFSGAYRVDLFTQIFKILITYGFCVITFMYGARQEIVEKYEAEYFMFLGFSVLGLMMLVSSAELISIVLSLEISSYSLYAIIPLRKGQKCVQLEATMKYLFFGAISTGVMLYGMGYLYGLTHSTFLVEIVKALPRLMTEPIGIFALILALTGFFFKLALFPFHFWAPDVYEGASNTTTTFIGTIPKIAGAALLIKIAMLAFPGSPQFVQILMVLAALSMTFGNLVGLVQKDLKRLLAYSGIAHAGYLLIGILSFSGEGNASVIYYITVYLFMNLACFYVVILLAGNGENIGLNDLSGLARRAPLLAFTLAVSAFSLAGIPPTGGFTGKLFLLTSAFRQGYLPIVIIGAVNSVISIFYYLNLVRMSYSKEAVTREPLQLTGAQKTLCYILIFLILYTGLLPFGLFELLRSAV